MKEYIDQGKYYPNLNVEDIERCCNGMGAEWMHEQVRKTLDKCFKEFEDAVIIHDVDYCYGLTEEDKEDADNRFLYNMRLSCWHEIPWYMPFKYLRFMGYAKLLYIAVDIGGDKAFKESKM